MSSEAATGKNYVDLHIHSTFSDGMSTISEIVGLASQKNIATIAVTDHDCIRGYPSARQLGGDVGLEVIPGVELSSEIGGVDIHILGYFIDMGNAALNRRLEEMKEARYHRAKKMVSNLNAMGVDLRFETVLKISGEAAIGRPHIAAAMLREELIYSFREAFDKFIGYDSPAYVEKLALEPRDVFQLILDAGGLPVLAHPGIMSVDERIPQFIRDGLAGIEVYHPEHSSAVRKHYLKYCQKYNLAYTGGSDFHSLTQIKNEIGLPRVPVIVMDRLREKYMEIFNREPAV
jgi:predicted metal-dependent phosphoesterase TrpH